jgi:hypothetical protein
VLLELLCVFILFHLFNFFVVLGFELKAFTLSYSTSPYL